MNGPRGRNKGGALNKSTLGLAMFANQSKSWLLLQAAYFCRCHRTLPLLFFLQSINCHSMLRHVQFHRSPQCAMACTVPQITIVCYGMYSSTDHHSMLWHVQFHRSPQYAMACTVPQITIVCYGMYSSTDHHSVLRHVQFHRSPQCALACTFSWTATHALMHISTNCQSMLWHNVHVHQLLKYVLT